MNLELSFGFFWNLDKVAEKESNKGSWYIWYCTKLMSHKKSLDVIDKASLNKPRCLWDELSLV